MAQSLRPGAPDRNLRISELAVFQPPTPLASKPGGFVVLDRDFVLGARALLPGQHVAMLVEELPTAGGVKPAEGGPKRRSGVVGRLHLEPGFGEGG